MRDSKLRNSRYAARVSDSRATAILDLSDEKVALIADSKHSSDELESGLPAFYDELIAVLQRAKATNPDGEWDPEKDRKVAASINSEMVARHGTEAFRLGYTVSQVVHGYGALCQAITEHATSKRASISPQEFNLLNLSLDIAIADAVTQFDRFNTDMCSARKQSDWDFWRTNYETHCRTRSWLTAR
jgi:hypothetical protein